MLSLGFKAGTGELKTLTGQQVPGCRCHTVLQTRLPTAQPTDGSLRCDHARVAALARGCGAPELTRFINSTSCMLRRNQQSLRSRRPWRLEDASPPSRRVTEMSTVAWNYETPAHGLDSYRILM